MNGQTPVLVPVDSILPPMHVELHHARARNPDPSEGTIGVLVDDLMEFIFKLAIMAVEYQIVVPLGPRSNLEPIFYILHSICLVSKRWRALALKTPRLWTNISRGFINMPSSPPLAFPALVLLGRHLPVHLSIGPSEAPGATLAFFRGLGQTDRIRSLDFTVRGSNLYRSLATGSAPWLQTAEFPCLQVLTLRGFAAFMGSAVDVQRWFGRLPGLVEFRLYGSILDHFAIDSAFHDFSIIEEPNPRTLTLPRLRVLSIEHRNPRVIDGLLKYINAPRLHTLCLRVSAALLAAGQGDILCDVGYTGRLAGVKNLLLRGCFEPETISTLVTHMPFATRLDISLTSHDPKWFDEFFLGIAFGGCLPYLQRLSLHRIRADADCLPQFIEGRKRSGKPLTTLAMSQDVANDRIFNELKEMVETIRWTEWHTTML